MLPSTARWHGPLAGSLVLSCRCSTPAFWPRARAAEVLGRVADPSGAVLGNVKVTLINEATGVAREAQTECQRRLRFLEVAAGQSTGWSSSWPASRRMFTKNVIVEVNQVVTLNIGPADRARPRKSWK